MNNKYELLADSADETDEEFVENTFTPFTSQWAATEQAKCLIQVRTRRRRLKAKLTPANNQPNSLKETTQPKAEVRGNSPSLIPRPSNPEDEVRGNSPSLTSPQYSPTGKSQAQVPREDDSPSCIESDDDSITDSEASFPAEVIGCEEWAPPLERPHQSSYFLPGKLERKPLQFLIDTGCNTNLISKRTYDNLPERIRSTLERQDRFGILADGSKLPFYGVIRLTGRVRDVPIEEVFVVSQISEDAILGMPFLAAHSCKMEFGNPIIEVQGKKLQCTDRHGRLLVSQVQVWREVTVQPGTEASIVCRVTSRNYAPIGVIIGCKEDIPIAASLNKPDDKGKVIVRCLNLTSQPLKVPAGYTLGSYTAVEEKEIYDPQWREVESPTTWSSGLQGETPWSKNDLAGETPCEYSLKGKTPLRKKGLKAEAALQGSLNPEDEPWKPPVTHCQVTQENPQVPAHLQPYWIRPRTVVKQSPKGNH